MEYEIDSSPIWLDVKKVLDANTPIPCDIYQMKIHTEKEDISVPKIINLSTVCDYVNANADQSIIHFIMPLGDYAFKLFPFRDNLEVSIRKKDIRNTFDKKPREEDVVILRYKAVFIKENPSVKEELSKYDIHTLNNAQILDVKLQLAEIAALPIMISRIYGNHTGKKPETLLREVITQGTANIEIDGYPALSIIDIYEPDNKNPIKNLVIKDGMHLVEFPRFLQESSEGVYYKGLGTYFTRYKDILQWFIYPVFDSERFEKDQRPRMIVYDIPKNKYANIERTFSIDGDVISILVTSGFEYKDNTGNSELNNGGGFKMLDARAVMQGSAVIKNGVAKFSRANTTHEAVFEDRADSLNYDRIVPISGNTFNAFSNFNNRKKAELEVQWQNSSPNHVYPGMPIKYVFYDGESVVEVYGNIAATDTSIDTTTKDYKESPYSVTTNMKLYIAPIEKLKDSIPDINTFGDF